MCCLKNQFHTQRKECKMNERDIVIYIRKLSKTYRVFEANSDSIRNIVFNIFKFKQRREIKALQTLNLDIRRGEFFGIIGRNGSGKSTLLDMVMKTLQPDKGGLIYTKGKMMKLSIGMGFDPNLTGRENVYVNGAVLGLSFKQIGRKFKEIFEFAELENFVDTKVKHYSKGMKARLAFAVAIHAEADIFLFDEFFGGVGDMRFKKKSDEVFKNSLLKDKTVVIVSHSLPIIKKHCKRVLCLDKGKILGIGPTEKMIKIYQEAIKKK